MTVIEPTRGPGQFVSRWRKHGPVDAETLVAWKEEDAWTAWLPLAEAALFLDAPELLNVIETCLSPAEQAVLLLVRRRWLGDTHLMEAIEEAINITQHPDTRDLILEGRLRMERGLTRYESGDAEGAEEDLTWAETRLKSVAKASRDHDLSLLNKAAFHLAQGEALMALQVYGDISRTGGHAHETIAISRMGASRIRASLGHMFDAGRHAWNAHKHAILGHQQQMAIEAGALFLELSLPYIDDSAPRMQDQVDNAVPRDAEQTAPILSVNIADVNGVFGWCFEHLGDGYGGIDRPDLRAMFSLAHRLDRVDHFEELIQQPDLVEDPMLAAVVQACCQNQELEEQWGTRLAQLTMLE